MAWVALDRAVKSVERFGFEGPLDRWRALRDEVRERILTFGFDAKRNAFTQYFGSAELDASCLRIPLVGFLPPSDPRVVGTIAAIERELMDRGFVFRYKQDTHYAVDGLPAGEGAFLACNFWLVDNYVLTGRLDDARKLFERILATANDVGLLAEEYEPVARRLVGNFPQAFSHVGLVNSALNLSQPGTRPPTGP
jgi:GH15 family glucan-1,4-alpha-glucosidase